MYQIGNLIQSPRQVISNGSPVIGCKYLTDDSFFFVNCLDALNFNLAKVVSFNKREYELSRTQHLAFGWVELTLWHVRVDIIETCV